LTGPFAVIRCLAFSPGGRRLLAAGPLTRVFDNSVALVWDVDTGGVAASLKQRTAFHRAQLSPDGRRVVTAGDDPSAWLWDADTGERLTELKHSGAVLHAEFSPDGKYVVTASKDRTARVWDSGLGDPMTPPLRHPQPVTSAAFSADGKRVLTVSAGRWTRVWDLAGDRLPREDDLTRLAQLLGQNRISKKKAQLVPLSAAEFRANWWALQANEGLAAGAGPGPSWHWRQAEDSAAAGQWSAVLWHVDRLITEHPSSALWARRGDAHRNLGKFEQALADYDRASKLLPLDPAVPWDRAALYREHGDTLMRRYIEDHSPVLNPLVSEVAFRQLIDPLRYPKGAARVRLDPQEAARVRDTYRECQQHLDKLPPAHAFTVRGKRDLLLSYLNLSTAHLQGDEKASGEDLQECLALLRALPVAHRPDAETIRQLADSFQELGDRVFRKNKTAAQGAFREALQLWEQPELAGDAGRTWARFSLCFRLGRADQALENPAAARAHFHQALAFAGAWTASAERNTTTPQSQWALAYGIMGDISDGLGNRGEARQYWRKALERAKTIAAKNTDDITVRMGLIKLHCNLGASGLQAGDFSGAITSYRLCAWAVVDLFWALERRPNPFGGLGGGL
jgi:tetratricopeptide (TPR) repeat protein